MKKLNVIGIRVDDRDDHAASVQKVLTNYGKKISGRFGVPAHDKHDGLITLIMEADSEDVQSFTADLRNIEGVAVNSMIV